jgi:cell division protein FtsX
VRVGLILWAWLALALLTACGSDSPQASPTVPTEAATVSPNPACALKIWVAQRATDAEIAAVRTRLRGDEAVESFRFVTSDEAFEELKAKSELLQEVETANPLSHEFRITLHRQADTPGFVQRYTNAQLPEVQKVAYADAQGFTLPCK